MIQKLFIVVVVIAGGLAVTSLAQNAWERAAVGKAVDDILLPTNAHTFEDRVGLQRQLAEASIKLVGEDDFFGPGVTYERPLSEMATKEAVFIYHYKPTIPLLWLDGMELPTSAGVKVVGTDVHASALIANVWWTQKRFFLFDEDVWVTRSVLVGEADVAGSGYKIRSDPWVEGDASKYKDEPWTVIEAFR